MAVYFDPSGAALIWCTALQRMHSGSLRQPFLDNPSLLMDDTPPQAANLRRTCSRRENLTWLLATLAALGLLAFTRLHAQKADGEAAGWPWPAVFAPLVVTAVAVALVLLASPLLLPRGDRYSAGATVTAVLLATTVSGFGWLACSRLQPSPLDAPCSPLPALLPAATLVLHRAWLHARWLRRGRAGAPAGTALALAPPPVLALPALLLSLGAHLATLALLWLQLNATGQTDSPTSTHTTAYTAYTAAAATRHHAPLPAPATAPGPGWWCVAAPLLALQVSWLVLACCGCAQVGAGSPPPPGLPANEYIPRLLYVHTPSSADRAARALGLQ